jgi:hypothetical protein
MFISLIALSYGADVSITGNSSPGNNNCIPFGMPYSNQSHFQGFIYKNMPAMTFNPGDTLAFDTYAQNDVDITMDIYVAAADSTNPDSEDANGFTQIAAGVTPTNPRGNTTSGDFDLEFVLNSGSFTFAGGGLIFMFQATANTAFASDNSCTQVLVWYYASDSSGYFQRRFYSDTDGAYAWSGSDTSSIGGFELTYGYRYADVDEDGFGDPATQTLFDDAPEDYITDGTDCDDNDAYTHPGAAALESETECMRDQDEDDFGDSFVSGDIVAGGDCNDGDATINPAAEEVAYDGIDNDCDGSDLCDVDLDGYDDDGTNCAGDDCDDTDPTINLGAEEIWYDGVDQDCNTLSDYDADEDGHDKGTSGGDDCDDADPDTYPGAPDTPYDGLVNDCDQLNEYDQDGDGYDSAEYGGTDCDDANSAINPGAEENWYDGVDDNCDENDDDQDWDGVPQVDDCDDLDPQVYACNTEDTAGGGSYVGGCKSSNVPGAGVGTSVLAMLGMLLFGMRRRS